MVQRGGYSAERVTTLAQVANLIQRGLLGGVRLDMLPVSIKPETRVLDNTPARTGSRKLLACQQDNRDMRKSIFESDYAQPGVQSVESWFDVQNLATVEVTSEDPAFPVEFVFNNSGG